MFILHENFICELSFLEPSAKILSLENFPLYSSSQYTYVHVTCAINGGVYMYTAHHFNAEDEKEIEHSQTRDEGAEEKTQPKR